MRSPTAVPPHSHNSCGTLPGHVWCAISVSQEFKVDFTSNVGNPLPQASFRDPHNVLRVAMAYLNQFEMSRQGQQWKDLGHRTNWCTSCGYHAINHAPWSMVHDSFRPNRAILSQLAVSATGQSTILLEFSSELRRYSRLPSPYQYV